MNNTYNYDMQYLFICMMLTDPELFTRCSNILKPSYFDKKLYAVVSYLHEYANKHNGLPSVKIINVEMDKDFQELDRITESDKDWFIETIEKFCRHKAIEKAILKGSDMLEKGDYNGLEKEVRDAVLVSLHRELGLNYYDNPRERLEKLRNENGDIKTGWDSLDEIVYNTGRGELLLFSAVTGGGKSVALQNITLNWAKLGYNVVYFTLELSEELVAKRIDSMLTGIPHTGIYKNLDNIELKVKNAQKNSGNIVIKYMDSGSTPNDIRAYLKEYTIQRNEKPDMVVIDYMDLLNPSSGKIKLDNLFLKDKMVAEELRTIGSPNNFDLVVASAVQINRCLSLDTLVYEKHKGLVYIDEIEKGDKLLSDGKYNEVKDIHYGHNDDMYKISTKTKNVTCSSKHYFPIVNGIKNIKLGLSVNDLLKTHDGFFEEIIEIKKVESQNIIDLSLDGDSLFYANDILTHNSGYEESIPGVDKTSGGISKQFTCDLSINVHNTAPLRERGEIEFQLTKTRNSGGVGKYVTLQYNPDTLRISDLDNTNTNNVKSNGGSSDNLKTLLSNIQNKS